MSDRRSLLSRAVVMLACVLSLALSITVSAQVTTGNIAGSVTDPSSGALPGVTVEAVHTPTGTRYSTVTEGTGRFVLPNVRVGGPYTVTANLEGFKPTSASNVHVNLGSTSEVSLKLQLAAVTEAITVTAKPDEIINPNRTGSTSAVAEKQIEDLPTVNRSLQDFARTNPYFTIRASDDSATEMAVAGRNNRYNNIQIDGAVNNDLFGLAATGTPGGQSSAQPISLDAVEQIQLVVSPYDVRQGGFTGGGVNVVTRSGTNKLSGSVFGTKRNQSTIGKSRPVFNNANFSGDGKATGIVEQPVVNFDYSQYGGRLGGPIMQDKLFFFVSGERNRRAQPDGTSADGSTGTSYANGVQDAVCGGVAGCSAARLRQDLITKYQYDPGDLGDIQKETPNNLIFGRLDFNVTQGNALTLRHNYVKGSNTIVSNRSTGAFRYPTSIYDQANRTNSTVAQLNSIVSASAFNEARVGVQTIKDVRATPVAFPSIEIGGANQNATLNAGTERFSGANALDQKITEITDDFTLIKGNHTIVFGTHNELFKFKNLFLSEFYGYYFYPTLAAFENQQCPTNVAANNINGACQYRISYATGSDPKRPTAFGAQQYGVYANDSWHVNNNFTLSMGIRFDKPRFNDTPSANPTVVTAIGFHTDTHPAEDLVTSPRIGFNWNPGASGKQQIRGGIGVFAGRTPYVWISNAYAGTGVEQVALACIQTLNSTGGQTCTVPTFSADPLNQPKLGAAGALSVDLLDPHFKFPRIMRATLGYDRDLFWGVRATGEVLYSKTLEDVYYENLNSVKTGTSPLDGRPTYSRVSSALVDATYLTNTTKGSDTTFSLQLVRPFTNGLTLSADYAHQNAKSAFDATSSRAISNWRFQHSQGDIFSPTLGRSAFEIKNRYNANLTYDFNTGSFGHTVGLFYNAQSGRPYSILFGTDINQDNNGSNDLFYVPGGEDKYILCPSQASTPSATNPCGGTVGRLANSTLTAYLQRAGLNPNDARILNKYESFEPWTRHLDFHYALQLPVRAFHSEVSFDMLNLLHWFSRENGNVYFVANQNVSPVQYLGIDAASGKPIYKEASTTLCTAADIGGVSGCQAVNQRKFGSLTPGRQFSIADLQSRWQMRLGFRITY